jgi:RNA polymerase sigma-70 factor (ECF subfamily)
MGDDAQMDAVESTGELRPERWVDEHGDHLYRYAYVRLRSHAVAEDVVQETFLAALKSRERYDPRYAERAWLMGILKHKVVDHIRKASREVQVEDATDLEVENSLTFKTMGVTAINPPKWQFAPHKALENKEFMKIFGVCLTRLQGKMHTAFVLRELEDHDTDTICKELGIKPNHLWVLLHRARAQLKSCLEANWLKAGERQG